MMEFENYRWEDHVPRAGSWKLNLAVAAVAFGLIAAALADDGVKRPLHMQAAASTKEVNASTFGIERRDVPAAFGQTNAEHAPCPTDYMGS
jgi:hypothetical protein